MQADNETPAPDFNYREAKVKRAIADAEQIIKDPRLPIGDATWEGLVAEADALGYRVLLVEWVECAETPGLLGQAAGSIAYGSKTIRIKESLDEHRRIQTLMHELDHARNPGAGRMIDKAWYEQKIDAIADELEREHDEANA